MAIDMSSNKRLGSYEPFHLGFWTFAQTLCMVPIAQ